MDTTIAMMNVARGNDRFCGRFFNSADNMGEPAIAAILCSKPFCPYFGYKDGQIFALTFLCFSFHLLPN
jgi:hypothetical protein